MGQIRTRRRTLRSAAIAAASGACPVPARDEPGRVALELRARLGDGSTEVAAMGEIEAVAPAPAPRLAREPGGQPLIAICLASYEPEPDLFRIQLDSIRSQAIATGSA